MARFDRVILRPPLECAWAQILSDNRFDCRAVIFGQAVHKFHRRKEKLNPVTGDRAFPVRVNRLEHWS
jgi:hypothetical protein